VETELIPIENEAHFRKCKERIRKRAQRGADVVYYSWVEDNGDRWFEYGPLAVMSQIEHELRGGVRKSRSLPFRSSPSAYRSELKQLIKDYKTTSGCAMCGVDDLPDVCYDLDHIDGDKVSNVSAMIMTHSDDDIWDEIDKCQVLCANEPPRVSWRLRSLR